MHISIEVSQTAVQSHCGRSRCDGLNQRLAVFQVDEERRDEGLNHGQAIHDPFSIWIICSRLPIVDDDDRYSARVLCIQHLVRERAKITPLFYEGNSTHNRGCVASGQRQAAGVDLGPWIRIGDGDFDVFEAWRMKDSGTEGCMNGVVEAPLQPRQASRNLSVAGGQCFGARCDVCGRLKGRRAHRPVDDHI
jgi:hypothetical protein